MNKKNTLIKSLTFFIALFCAMNLGFGQIVAWEMNGLNGNESTVDATTLATNLNMSTLSRGSGLNPSARTNSFASNSFTGTAGTPGTQTDAINNFEYLQFQVSVSTAGYQVSLSTLDANFLRQFGGPSSFIWSYSTDGINFTDILPSISYTTISAETAQTQIDLSIIPALQNVGTGTTITFRLYGWGARLDFGWQFAIGNLAGYDLSIGGTVACSTTTTYTTSGWSNGPPDSLSKSVIIDDNFTTSPGNNIQACSLLVRNGATLTITDETYVEIENDATVDGVGSEILVETFGAFVQRGSSNTAFNLTNGGTAILNKTTREYSNIPGLNYVYWSSPVASANLETVFPNPYLNRRYYFDATLFLDEFTVGASGPPATSGIPDGIDDNGDDWQTASGTMEIGHGYVIATENSAPYIDEHQFEGNFNTGNITVPIFKNVFPGDENSNLIGNPYPCAIDAYRFIDENYYHPVLNEFGTITGAIYTWTSNTLPTDAIDGNYTYNFSQDDYTTINLVGSAGIGPPPPPGVVADPIFSGQGFFVSYHNDGVSTSSDGDIDGGEVYFNNDMRVSQGIFVFNPFKVSNTKNEIVNSNPNKLWVNLTSDNGVFNQVLIGYLNLATNNYDGEAFDAPKGLLSLGAPSILYTTIPDDSDKKFIIQGKAESSLNQDEVINLGFDTKIDVPTIYTLSIAQLQGDFLTNNPIYLKDNVANTIHDLSASDYSFTSEVGEFKDRFEIVFTNQALSNDTFDVALNTLQIKQVNDTQVQFSTSNDTTIKQVRIYDLLGRALYELDGNNSVETYNLSNLNNSVFIAKVALSNGAIVTKKAIKK